MIDLRRRAGRSERAIKAELAKKGIAREISNISLQGGSGELERLKELVAKKQKLARYKADPQKLMRYLAGQGFSYDDIKRAMGRYEDDL